MFESSFRFARVKGIPVGAHWSWILVFLLVTWSFATGLFPDTYPGLSGATYLAMAVTAAVLGVYLSFFIDSAPAPTVVLLLTAIFIVAFAVSAFLAGLGGAMLSMQQGNVNYASNFIPFAALFWLAVVVSIGSRTVEDVIVTIRPARLRSRYGRHRPVRRTIETSSSSTAARSTAITGRRSVSSARTSTATSASSTSGASSRALASRETCTEGDSARGSPCSCSSPTRVHGCGKRSVTGDRAIRAPVSQQRAAGGAGRCFKRRDGGTSASIAFDHPRMPRRSTATEPPHRPTNLYCRKEQREECSKERAPPERPPGSTCSENADGSGYG